MSKKDIEEFIDLIRKSLHEETFIKLALGSYKGSEAGLKKILARKINIKSIPHLSFTYRYQTRDIIKNYSFDDSLEKITDFFCSGFGSATLFCSDCDISYPSFKKSKGSLKNDSYSGHDRVKNRFVKTKDRAYLHDLKITDKNGDVLKSAQDKFRQIDKYIEILSSHIKSINANKPLNITDMGSGKGYLTFALYDYLLENRGANFFVTGVEYRQDLVDLCNKISKISEFNNLSFVQGTIENYDARESNILIALHACDTATDDAIAKGVKANADLIVVAPCCHKQIRKQMDKNQVLNMTDFIVRHGIFMERQAEMITDSLRALILEYAGYNVKVFEFISGEHTAKNIMIVASKGKITSEKKVAIKEKISQIKKDFGIDFHALEKIL